MGEIKLIIENGGPNVSDIDNLSTRGPSIEQATVYDADNRSTSMTASEAITSGKKPSSNSV